MAKRSATAKTSATAMVISRAMAIRLLGVSDRTFARLQAEGVFEPCEAHKGTRAGKYDAVSLVQAYITHVRGRDESPKSRLERVQGDLQALKLDRERGVVIERTAAVKEAHRYIAAVQAHLRQGVVQLGQEGVPPEIRDRVSRFVESSIEEFSRWPTRLDYSEESAA